MTTESKEVDSIPSESVVNEDGETRTPAPPPALLSDDRLLSYRPRLDGLRCVAIVLVMIEHFGGVLAGVIPTGYYGVDLYFVISGYLITTILLKPSGDGFATSYRTFVGRRALRIFPPYYLLIAVLAAINFEPTRELLLSLVTYTFNYAAVNYRAAGNENPLYYLWSLSVEEQFYLIWPILVISIRKHRRLVVAVTAAMVVAGYSQLAFGLVPSMTKYDYTGLFNRMGSLGLGALGAAYVSWKPLPAAFFKSLIAEVAVLVVLIAGLIWFSKPLSFLVGLCSLFLVLKAVHFGFRIRAIDRFLAYQWVVYIGSVSYGVYLFHVPVGVLFTTYLFDPVWNTIPFESLGPLARLEWNSWIFKFPLYSALSIAVASASYKWFESRVLRLKDRWFGYHPHTLT